MRDKPPTHETKRLATPNVLCRNQCLNSTRKCQCLLISLPHEESLKTSANIVGLARLLVVMRNSCPSASGGRMRGSLPRNGRDRDGDELCGDVGVGCRCTEVEEQIPQRS